MRSHYHPAPQAFAGKEHDMKRIITIGREFGSGGRELSCQSMLAAAAAQQQDVDGLSVRLQGCLLYG